MVNIPKFHQKKYKNVPCSNTLICIEWHTSQTGKISRCSLDPLTPWKASFSTRIRRSRINWSIISEVDPFKSPISCEIFSWNFRATFHEINSNKRTTAVEWLWTHDGMQINLPFSSKRLRFKDCLIQQICFWNLLFPGSEFSKELTDFRENSRFFSSVKRRKNVKKGLNSPIHCFQGAGSHVSS